MKYKAILPVILIFSTLFLPVVYGEETNKINVELNNLYSDNGENIADYQFVNPFNELNIYGVYIGTYFNYSIYNPFLLGNEKSFNVYINITEEMVGKTFTEFYIFSPFIEPNDERCEFDGFQPISNQSTAYGTMFKFKGVYNVGIHKVSFITTDTNIKLKITDEYFYYNDLTIDNIQYEIPYNIDFKMIITNGGQKDLSIINFDLKPNEYISFNIDLKVYADGYHQWLVPCLSKDLYYYTATVDDFVPTSISGYNNHHIVFNKTSPASAHFYNVFIRIENKKDYDISVALYFNDSYYTETYFYPESSPIKIKGSLLYFAKYEPSTNYTEMWKLYDLEQYKENKISFSEFFAYIHNIIDIKENKITFDSKSEELIYNIRNSIISNINLNTVDTITGYISNIEENIYNHIKEIGAFIVENLKKFVNFIISIVKEIINFTELLFENVILPVIQVFMIMFTVYYFTKGIYYIKRYKHDS